MTTSHKDEHITLRIPGGTDAPSGFVFPFGVFVDDCEYASVGTLEQAESIIRELKSSRKARQTMMYALVNITGHVVAFAEDDEDAIALSKETPNLRCYPNAEDTKMGDKIALSELECPKCYLRVSDLDNCPCANWAKNAHLLECQGIKSKTSKRDRAWAKTLRKTLNPSGCKADDGGNYSNKY